MPTKRLNLIVIAGPNGAGKSTTASSLLKGTLEVPEFVNADLIAQGLSGFQPEGAVFHAGRVMLERIHYLAKKRVDFAFETTLASRTFAPWIAELLKTGCAWVDITCLRRLFAGDIMPALVIFSDYIALWQTHGFFMTIPGLSRV